MTTINKKAVLFAGLILTLIVPVSGTLFADAQTQLANQERIAAKIQHIDDNFAQYKLVRIATDLLEAERVVIEEKIERTNPNDSQIEEFVKQRDAIQKKIDSSYEEIDRLQDIAFELYEIPEERQQLLDSSMKEIIETYSLPSKENPNTVLDDVFINAKDESIYVLKNTKAIERDASLQTVAANLESEINAMVDDSIEVIFSEGIDESGCTYDYERDDYCQPSAGGVKIQGANTYDSSVETSTLSFPATRDSVSGFVMIGHGTLTLDGGEDIYQPTKPSYKIGDLVVGFNDSDCDCSFIDLSPGRTVDAEVVYNTIYNLDIDDYIPKSSQSEGQYVTMSGIGSGVELGQIVSTDTGNSWVYADYDSTTNDSGAPVGKVLSGEIDIYGIHKGRVPGEEEYARYVPYDAIEYYLELD